jgi:hypothetical protein
MIKDGHGLRKEKRHVVKLSMKKEAEKKTIETKSVGFLEGCGE